VHGSFSCPIPVGAAQYETIGRAVPSMKHAFPVEQLGIPTVHGVWHDEPAVLVTQISLLEHVAEPQLPVETHMPVVGSHV
jgi:hypothetical protein